MKFACGPRMVGIVFGAIAMASFMPAYGGNEALKSFLPRHGLAKFIVAELDVRSFADSPMPTPVKGTDILKSRLSPTHVDAELISFENKWVSYGFRILERGDRNQDGIEDVLVCYTWVARQGSGRSQRTLLLTKYSKDTPLIAIDFNPYDKRCPEVQH